MKSIYKSSQAREEILLFYDQKAQSLNFPFTEKDVLTSFGKTRVLISGKEGGKVIVVFHAIHAGAPLTMECIKNLEKDYKIYAIDTVGQATKSAETTINPKDDSFALWADEVLEKLNIEKADFIGVSYGAFIIQKLIKHKQHKIGKCIFVVPCGFANSDPWSSLTKLILPQVKFQLTKKESDLRKFLRSFAPEDDKFMFEFQRAILKGMHLDYKRPPILQKKDVEGFSNPVYLIVADEDIFYPAQKCINQAKLVFQNVGDVHILKGSKHVPHNKYFEEIEKKIHEWLG